MATRPKQGQWTYNDYASLPNDGWRYEVMNGVLIMIPAPNKVHQSMVIRFVYYLFPHVDLVGLGKVIVAPFDVELTSRRVVQPDVLVVLNANLQNVTSSRLIGPPDLAIEIASPGTASYDRLSKYEAYEQAGVSEYWLADTEERNIEVLTLEHGKDTIPSRIAPGISTVEVHQFFV
jgi:Uma2 family endonuclease